MGRGLSRGFLWVLGWNLSLELLVRARAAKMGGRRHIILAY